jgi:Tfp pilus assembly protein PilF
MDTLAYDNILKAKQIDSTSLEYASAVADYCFRTSDYDGYFAELDKIFSERETPLSMKMQVLETLLHQPKLSNLYPEQILSFYDALRGGRRLSYQIELLYAQYLLQNQHREQALSCLRAAMENARIDTALKSVMTLRQSSPYFKSYALESLAFYNLSGLYLELLVRYRQWDEIIAAADRYVLRNEDKSKMLFFRLLAQLQKEEYVEAVKSAEESLKQMVVRDTALLLQTYSILGDAYNNLGRYSQSDKAFDKVLSLDPTNISTLNNYAYYLSLRGKNLKKALSMSKLAIEEESDNPTYLDTYAWILFQMGRYKESKEVLQKALVYGGDREAVILEHYGDVLFKLGELSNAVIYWERAKEHGNTSTELLQKNRKTGT